MKYKSNTKDEILSLRLSVGWKSALREIANSKGLSLNQMLFEDIDKNHRLQINKVLNKNRVLKTYDSVEDMPLYPDWKELQNETV